jgi:hypothetical protein
MKAIGMPVHLAFTLERVRAERARVLRLQAAVLATQHVEGKAQLSRKKDLALEYKFLHFKNSWG